MSLKYSLYWIGNKCHNINYSLYQRVPIDKRGLICVRYFICAIRANKHSLEYQLTTQVTVWFYPLPLPNLVFTHFKILLPPTTMHHHRSHLLLTF